MERTLETADVATAPQSGATLPVGVHNIATAMYATYADGRMRSSSHPPIIRDGLMMHTGTSAGAGGATPSDRPASPTSSNVSALSELHVSCTTTDVDNIMYSDDEFEIPTPTLDYEHGSNAHTPTDTDSDGETIHRCSGVSSGASSGVSVSAAAAAALLSEAHSRGAGGATVGSTTGAMLSGLSSDDDADDEGDASVDDASVGDDASHGPHPRARTAVMKTVLLTGGAGFIGSHVADVLLSRGDRVIILDEMNDYYDVNMKRYNLNLLQSKYGDVMLPVHHSGVSSGVNAGDDASASAPAPAMAPALTVYEGDVCDAALVSRIYQEHKPDHVCHLAARAGVRPSIIDPFIYVHSNVEGTVRLLEAAARHGCTHFVYASSSSVYGGLNKAVFAESDAVDNPVSPYAATKKACELMAHVYHSLHKLDVAGLRFFTVYGPRGRPDMAPFKFIDGVARGLSIQRFGDGTSSRDYTYVDDIVDGVIRALDRPRGYQVYNLGNRRPVSLNTFIRTVESAVGKSAVIVPMPEQPGDVPHTCADVSKARAMLGYRPSVRFEEGIKRTVAWYMSAVKTGVLPSLPEEHGVSSSGRGDDASSLLASKLAYAVDGGVSDGVRSCGVTSSASAATLYDENDESFALTDADATLPLGVNLGASSDDEAGNCY